MAVSEGVVPDGNVNPTEKKMTLLYVAAGLLGVFGIGSVLLILGNEAL